mmetsp:Transcript_121795/g.221546  ORF Transcript_121795/g.221546 Transcript_121795/m.221546 type:complete len:80 (+) Transcript_121795:1-240(+)
MMMMMMTMMMVMMTMRLSERESRRTAAAKDLIASGSCLLLPHISPNQEKHDAEDDEEEKAFVGTSITGLLWRNNRRGRR